MKILFTTPILEHPAKGGPPLRIENSIKALASLCDLYILNRTVRRNSQLKETDDFFSSLSVEYHTFFLDQTNTNSSIRYSYKKILNRINSAKRSYELLDRVVKENGIDIIWFGYGNISYSLIRRVRNNMPEAILICDTDSVWSRFILREIPYAKKFRKLNIFIRGTLKKLQEKRLVKMCDVVTAVSDVDANYYKSLTKDKKKIKVFSNVIDLENYKIRANPPQNLKKPAVYLAGTFGHYNSPMDTAARWLIDEIMPLVWKQRAEVQLYIVGRGLATLSFQTDDPRISVIGEVETVLPYLQNIDVALVPLKFESGTRFKILEAAACKIPIVSTALGAEGIDVKDFKDIIIADSTEDFAKAIMLLLSDKKLSSKLAKNGLVLVEEQYSLNRIISEGVTILSFANTKRQEIKY